MRRNLILATCFFGSAYFGELKAQDTIFYDSFEAYEDWVYEDIGEWTLIDGDGIQQYGIAGVSFPDNIAHPFAAKIVNSTTAIPNVSDVNIPGVRNYEANTGDKVLGMFAALLPTNNDWIISPKIQLGEEENQLSFFVKSAYMTNQKHEKFRVLISTTNTNPDSFTAFPQVYEGDYFTNSEWTEITINLDDYSNMEVYLAINYISEVYDDPTKPAHLQKRAATLLLDDFKVTKGPQLGINDLNSNSLQIYPNPVTDVLNIKNLKNIQSVSAFDLSGKKLMTQKLNESSTSIQTSHLKSGVYLIQIQSDNKVVTKKFIKK